MTNAMQTLFVSPPAALIGTVGTVPDGAPIAAIPVQHVAVDWSVLLPLIFAGIALLITTSVSAWASVKTKHGLRASAAAGQVRDRKLDHITVLVNGRYSQVLQELADVKRQFAALSGREEDRHQAARAQARADAHAGLAPPPAPGDSV